MDGTIKLAPNTYRVTTHPAIREIPASDWNRLASPDTPFMRHEFLAAMEDHGCVGESLGWLPMHLALRDEHGHLLGAAPCYLKSNSYGEFVFDWSWADAYHRHGLSYYPKLVIASPYTPATGPRILTEQGAAREQHASALIQAAARVVERLGVSSTHCLFNTDEEANLLELQGFMRRVGCQFHWNNRGYENFDQMLDTFTSTKRKQIKRERRRVTEAGLRLRRVRGDEVTEEEWGLFHRLYCNTFDKRGGLPTLTLPFFQAIAQDMGENLLLVLAYQGNRIVAAAFNLVGRHSLYGRHWGCTEDFHSLHFEACYYQGLEYCIEQGLNRFEPGAQGEHKVSRGFLPTRTWSGHWVADPTFRAAIARFLEQDTRGMDEYLAAMQTHSPYRALA
ncbi:GNAT family N-acetyltransferase [Thiorhodococcus fuscus]|uniref:GNAT family N-acetyltransferase n=1 Tax=Thiorhodococcus fuscus TaxID=527200 RepID=A0ABW4Y5J7_9GAMM